MERLTLARNGMATRFEFVLAGTSLPHLRAAGEEALDEIERIEARLSLYRPGSEIAQVNARAASEPVRLSPEVFMLLEKAREFWQKTGGTFDPTIAPLMRCWGFMKSSGALPSPEEIAAARELVGFQHVTFDPDNYSVSFERRGMMLDLGSIGKGYALDCAAEILRDNGVENALLHGGTSTIIALGSEPGRAGWRVAIDHPDPEQAKSALAVIELCSESLSVSAVWGKSFEAGGKRFGHVLDPRTGWPAEHAVLGAVVLDSATASDALSTAVLLGNQERLEALREEYGGMRYLQLRATEADSVLASGIKVDKSLDIPEAGSV